MTSKGNGAGAAGGKREMSDGAPGGFFRFSSPENGPWFSRMSNTRVGVIDIGSNSIKILVAEGREVTPVFERTLEVRISPGPGEPQDMISEAALAAGVGAVSALLPEADLRGVSRLAIVATSMVREAANRDDFAEAVELATGEPLRVLTGAQEAAGIAAGVATDPALAGAAGLGVFDLGGGSLEFIHLAKGRIARSLSLRMGAVRMTRLHVSRPESPVPEAALAAIRAEVRGGFGKIIGEAVAGGPLALAGCGGAFSAARAMLGARVGRSAKDTPPAIAVSELENLLKLVAASPQETRLAIPGIPAARADILPAAFATLLEVASLAKAGSFTHSWRNLRYGVAAGLLGAPGGLRI